LQPTGEKPTVAESNRLRSEIDEIDREIKAFQQSEEDFGVN